MLTLLHPTARGPLSYAANRVTWSVTKTASRRLLRGQGLSYAGPLAVVTNVLAWAGAFWLGFALIYLPFIGSFSFAPATPFHGRGFAEALYMSGAALTTLGFGDVVPTSVVLRLVTIAEAASGFVALLGRHRLRDRRLSPAQPAPQHRHPDGQQRRPGAGRGGAGGPGGRPIGDGRGGEGAHREPRAPAAVPGPLLLRVGQRRGVSQRVTAGQRHAAGGPPLRPLRGGQARLRVRRRARTHRLSAARRSGNGLRRRSPHLDGSR